MSQDDFFGIKEDTSHNIKYKSDTVSTHDNVNKTQTTDGHNIFDQEYFGDVIDSKNKGMDKMINNIHSSNTVQKEDLTAIDQEYFESVCDNKSLNFDKNQIKTPNRFRVDRNEVNSVDQDYFSTVLTDANSIYSSNSENKMPTRDKFVPISKSKRIVNQHILNFDFKKSADEFIRKFRDEQDNISGLTKKIDNIKKNATKSTSTDQTSVSPTLTGSLPVCIPDTKNITSTVDQFRPISKSRQTNINQTENPDSSESADEFVRKFRNEKKINLYLNPEAYRKEKVDSKGYRIPCEQKFAFNRLTTDEAADILFRCIIVQTDDVVVFNKPYGLPSHAGPLHKYSVAQLLPIVAHRIRVDELHLIHRLDKETTGVMLVAKNKSMAHTLKEAFINRWFQKRYLCITKGVPLSPEGVIDIPIKQADVANGIHKMMIRPRYGDSHSEYSSLMQHYSSQGAHDAVTCYSVLERERSSALVECRPITGVTHQIRVHLAQGLNTPILGDHKYSTMSRMVPQRLSADMLRRLAVQQSKVRYISLHLHAHRLTLGETNNDSDYLDKKRTSLGPPPPTNLPQLNFFAPLPDYFLKNMRRLGLHAPKYLNIARSTFI